MNRTILSSFLVIVAILFSATFFAFSSCSTEQSKYPKLDQYLETLGNNNKFMGSISIFRGDTQIYSKVIGYSDVKSGDKATVESRYKIGSISKSFTAVLVMQAIEKGLISLETTLDNYFPSIQNSNKITIENMLRHRSGITNYFDMMSKFTEHKTQHVMLDSIILRSKKDVVSAPDSITSYSNSNYLLLSYILEEIYDEKFSEILDNNIVKPLRLKNTLMPDSQEGCYSHQYAGDRWDVEETETHPSAIMGAGGIVSTPMDLNLFYHALFSGKLVSKESLNQMKTIDKMSPLPLGIGLLGMPFQKKMGYGHTGSIDGYISVSVYHPENNISISITTNGLNYNYNYILKNLLHAIYDIPFKIPTFKKSINLSKEDIPQYLGTYENLKLRQRITISNQENMLTLQVSGEKSVKLTTIGKDSFELYSSGIKQDIIFNPTEQVLTFKMIGLTFEYLNVDSEKYIYESSKKPIVLTEEDLDKYLGSYVTHKLPRLSVTKKGNVLVAQGKGQPFNLDPIEKHTFEFALAGIVMIFDPENSAMTLTRDGKVYEMLREEK